MSHRGEMNPETYRLPAELEKAVRASFEDWRSKDKVRRLWNRDVFLMDRRRRRKVARLVEPCRKAKGNLPSLKAIAEEVRKAGFSHVLLLGMGGSSLCPEVMKMTFGKMGRVFPNCSSSIRQTLPKFRLSRDRLILQTPSLSYRANLERRSSRICLWRIFSIRVSQTIDRQETENAS